MEPDDLKLPPPRASITHEERNSIILRRTLSAASWLYALWSVLLGTAAWSQRADALLDARLFFLHAALFGLAGALQWKPRRGALLCTILAAAGSIFFVALDFRSHSIQSAIVDGAYVPIAAVLLYKSRRQA